jgi:hypothetical protein
MDPSVAPHPALTRNLVIGVCFRVPLYGAAVFCCTKPVVVVALKATKSREQLAVTTPDEEDEELRTRPGQFLPVEKEGAGYKETIIPDFTFTQ